MKTLGIDLGTTKVAVVVYDDRNGTETVVSGAHHGAVPSREPTVFEQDPAGIMECLTELLAQIPREQRSAVSAVGITGQMHSLLLKDGARTSNLITWQDHRCGGEAIARFNRISGLKLREGFGGASLARMAAAGELHRELRAAALGDYLASEITGSRTVITDPTHAASWGIYDCGSGDWNFAALGALGIPPEILPEIRPCGAVIGHVSEAFGRANGLPVAAKVVNAIGDNQASILGTGEDFEREIYLTLGTGAQLSVVCRETPSALPEKVEVRPFPGNRQLLVSAPLCGGAAFAFLADAVNRFRTALGEAALERGKLLNRLDALGMEYLRGHGEPSITIQPHFLGERYDPGLRGSVNGLTLENAEPGALTAALAFGIVRTLKEDFPAEALSARSVVIGSGNAVRLNQCIRYAVEQEFALPLRLSAGCEEAAAGAAKQALAVCGGTLKGPGISCRA